MKKNKCKRLLLTAFTSLFLLVPVRDVLHPQTVLATQVSASHDSKLSAFDIAPGVLSPVFSPDITEYTSTVDADVTSVSVQAVPRASGAVIASVEGRDGLHPGVNTIKVTCSAQDNTYTVYTITLTVGSADAGTQQPDTAQQPDTTQQPDEEIQQPDTGTQQPDTTQQPDAGDTPSGENTTNMQDGNENDGAQTKQNSKKRSLPERLSGAVKADGTVKLSGAAYKLSNNFTYGSTAQDIPSAFGQGSVQIGENSYSTLYCQSNGVHLVYMENTDGQGATGFYFYDEIKQVVERFKYTGIEDNFVIFISNAREEVPAGFQEKALKFPSGKKAAAYQSGSSNQLKDYYLVYGIHSDGTSGWYLYDKKQGTYMRYSAAFATAQGQEEDGQEEEVERTVSLTKYNTLNEKYTELKESRVKIVSILVIAIILVIIIFTALLLRSQGDEDDEEEDEVRVHGRKKKSGKPGKQTETISKSSLAAGRNFEGNVGKRSKKVTKTFTQEPVSEPQQRPSAHQDHISTPEEIRAQMSRRESGGYASQPLHRERISAGATDNTSDTMQAAAQRMRQSVKYARKPVNAKPDMAEPEHDPMDDWDMEETMNRKSQKAARPSRKRRSRLGEDMEIMDLNDL